MTYASINKIVVALKPYNGPFVSFTSSYRTQKTRDLQFCVDYRKLDSITKPDVYPIQDISLSLDTSLGAKL